MDRHNPLPALIESFRILGQAGLPGDVAEFWDMARECWRLERVPGGLASSTEVRPEAP